MATRASECCVSSAITSATSKPPLLPSALPLNGPNLHHNHLAHKADQSRYGFTDFDLTFERLKTQPTAPRTHIHAYACLPPRRPSSLSARERRSTSSHTSCACHLFPRLSQVTNYRRVGRGIWFSRCFRMNGPARASSITHKPFLLLPILSIPEILSLSSSLSSANRR